MEKLTVHNFLTIQSAEIEIKKVNILIGPQASGKSVIAKLLYFFRKEIGDSILENVINMQNASELNATMNLKFNTIFPKACWHNQAFVICYENSENKVCISNQKNESGYLEWSINYSESLLSLKAEIEEKLNPKEPGSNALKFAAYGFRVQNKYPFETQIFIPAARSFFSTLQKNFFSLLASGIDFDFFIKEFGAVYEQSKNEYVTRNKYENEELLNQLYSIVEGIICGQYAYENNQDWILNDSKKTNLANASSGQQESLPMLLVLMTVPFYFQSLQARFFIEEPEAHLFPVSQKELVSLFALINHETQHQLFITTHSPYLLTAFNNCIMAHSTFQAVNEQQKNKVLEIVPENQHIAFSDVAAWTITPQGTVESILDEEYEMIGAGLLDGVSQEFETITNALLDIRYGE